MSKLMLNDENAMDNMNPFVQTTLSLPGAIGQPHAFEVYEPKIEKDEIPWNDNTYICETGITSGDKVVDTCRPSKLKCQLSRPLLPGRNIDMGVSEQVPIGKKVAAIVTAVKGVVKDMKKLDIITIVLLVLIILLLSSARR
tara:strand:- start:46 stop:468 length:423 start_codon:yes stop_codon:yes gene_type:complete